MIYTTKLIYKIGSDLNRLNQKTLLPQLVVGLIQSSVYFAAMFSYISDNNFDNIQMFGIYNLTLFGVFNGFCITITFGNLCEEVSTEIIIMADVIESNYFIFIVLR